MSDYTTFRPFQEEEDVSMNMSTFLAFLIVGILTIFCYPFLLIRQKVMERSKK